MYGANLIEQNKLWSFEHGACNGNALFFTAAQLQPTLSNQSTVA